MSRNISKEDLKTMCTCRLHVTPGQTFICPVHGEKTNKGIMTNPVVSGMKVGQTPDGKRCVEVKSGMGWTRKDGHEFDTDSKAEAHLKKVIG